MTAGKNDGRLKEVMAEAHYFFQNLDGEPKAFGWVSGDEQALPRTHRII